jgi:hypothetical protein
MNILDESVLQQSLLGVVVVESWLNLSSDVLKLPGVLSLVMQQSWVVVSLIKVFKDRREYLWLFVRENDSLAIRF